MIGNQTIEAFGDELYAAFSQRQPVQPLTDRLPNLTIEDSYVIQQRMLKRRLEKGEKVVGKKVGINSEIVSLGAGAAVLGHPAAAVAMMVNQSKEEIPAGAVLLAGAITEAVAVKAGDSITYACRTWGVCPSALSKW